MRRNFGVKLAAAAIALSTVAFQGCGGFLNYVPWYTAVITTIDLLVDAGTLAL